MSGMRSSQYGDSTHIRYPIRVRRAGEDDLDRFRTWCRDAHGSTNAEASERALESLFSPTSLDSSVALIAESRGRCVAALMASAARFPLFDRPMGVLHTLYAEPCGSASDALASLLGELDRLAEAFEWPLLRMLIPAAATTTYQPLVDQGLFQLAHGVIQKELRPCTWREPLPGVNIRSATPEDCEFLIELIADAQWKGLTSAERARLSFSRVRYVAESFLIQLIGPGMIIRVAEVDGSRVGHATAAMEYCNEFTGWTGAFLHDTYVLEEFRNRGIGTLLTKVIESVAWERGQRFLAGTVFPDQDGKLESTLDNLHSHGWNLQCRVYSKVLPQRAAMTPPNA